MSNFYKDNEDILFHIKNQDLSRIVSLREDNFNEKNKFPYAPQSYEDALDNYDRVLDIVGDIAGNFIAPRAPGVDAEGAHFENGEVRYAQGTAEAIDRLKKADLLGFTIPRQYGGINMPKTIYSAAIEMVSRGDASLMNIFGLQEIAETIYKFGSDDQRTRYLPRFTSGAVTGAMSLTEPDAGSDLQSVATRAEQDSNGDWRITGVKRFITNGRAQVSLVMARSEHGTSGGKGISLFIYDRDKNMKIRRIEHKLGIKGSPTCELQFNGAKAELLGTRKMGLIKYTMSLMNGARLGVAAQSLGIAEAAYREADKYAKERSQFKQSIRDFTAIYEMLTDMKVNIEAARSLLYETSRIVDIKEGIEDAIEHHVERKNDLGEDLKRYTKFASLFTPMVKAYAAETCNKVAFDALQIHGGVGFTCEFNIERHYRDARITNIYEGTTQLQVVAAIGGVTSGVVLERLNDYENSNDFNSVAPKIELARRLRTHLESAVSFVKEINDEAFTEFHARRLVEMSTDVTLAYLLCIDATKNDRKKAVAEAFLSKAKIRVKNALDYITSNDRAIINNHQKIIG
ncbi:MAG: acyl-CoA dehydrogenase [Bdellovibrionales bacterium RIFOXYD12_FULL_39_22]|nr:MAG: acyl-CoA dehydrogenase [Bdellovibrionales bacterium RIFOXYB1_FULL_39_21]OFZ42897.1 MAG: acyl-CoA dehydrogenase [Bdellovibrionales bacterium RIFOXYC12_FULL_39_17]OFZ47443.1 MAG: acyl-CoA dehydrogenase [Bdellovibrionales bacterium RIFOXYC1_FULL_39_130]OFZ75531.1 MAG: acyl-CoA dehydrogenase [Bdellovibrionales bacterium RIFOXYD1_FULL_39_84]OFZ93854.1 MAG: acyl-CoA dehydrogenase [Bdellovibrionales bacterium RIFOXYD12_FULL_39_22]HLE10142.1 acyl-CoA dehydrogenase family protein [Bacteriovorac